MISRRSGLKAIAGLPFVGRSAAAVLAKQGTALQAAGASIGAAGCDTLSSSANAIPQGPFMPEWRAMRLALQAPGIRELLIESAQRQCRVVTGIDPDIEILRSFSPMAKITFQRQRNVQRMLESATEEPIWDWGQRARDYIRKLMWGS